MTWQPRKLASLMTRTACVGIILLGSAVGAASGTCCPRVDELWLISTRCVPCLNASSAADPGRLRFQQFDRAKQSWRQSDSQSFFSADALPMPTVIWVHGDRIEDCEAPQIGWDVYSELIKCRDPALPIRFVIWSWPSALELRGHPARDSRIKASRTLAAGYWLGWLLTRLNPDEPVSLIGYSYGARIVTGGLHAASGGSLGGHVLSELGPERSSGYNVVLLASAMNTNWLQPGCPHELATTQIDRLLLLNNYCDWVLKRYPRVSCGPSALGYTGLSKSAVAQLGVEVCQVNAGQYVGKRHELDGYLYSTPLSNLIREYALPE